MCYKFCLFLKIISLISLTCNAGYEKLFIESQLPFSRENIVTDPLVLRDAVRDVLPFFKKHHKLTNSKIMSRCGIKPGDIFKTLNWIIKIVDEDEPKGRFRISNSQFLNKHFRCVKWCGDALGAKKDHVIIPPGPDGGKLRDGRIKLTSYAVFTVDGSYKKTKKFNTALYGYNRHKSKTKGRSGRKMLINENGKGLLVKPLVWVSQRDADDALMQGSMIVRMPDGKRRTFYMHTSRKVADR
ncbi:hypothetical protein KAU11_06060, partial [Candidatus Babeliales bacterium]|nr:hypothetical protein [Candidatus Babeliales bacterium]